MGVDVENVFPNSRGNETYMHEEHTTPVYMVANKKEAAFLVYCPFHLLYSISHDI